MIYQCPSYYSMTIQDATSLNDALLDGYSRFAAEASTKKTHKYECRYENVYISKDKIPQIGQILSKGIEAAADILKLESRNLRAGLWFNAMPPGSRTLKHAHDDDDELISAVYYVSVPENSGHLILHNRNFITHVMPQAGMFVFFPPDVQHEVTENCSKAMRLSLGINIGLINPED